MLTRSASQKQFLQFVKKLPQIDDSMKRHKSVVFPIENVLFSLSLPRYMEVGVLMVKWNFLYFQLKLIINKQKEGN